jgi:signal transduction histidine kinase
MTAAADPELASLRCAKAELVKQLDERTAERDKAQAQQNATSAILHVISQSPTDMQPVFDAIVLAAVRLLRCDGAFVIRCDSANFWPVASAGPEGLFPSVKTTGGPIDPDANFPSRAIVGKQTLHLPDWTRIDLPEHERHVRDTHGINSALFVPLLRKSECIGLLTMTGKRAGIFGESGIALAESFRDQALIAIDNVSMFEELQQRTRELSLSLEELRTAKDRLVQAEKLASLGQLTAGIAHEINGPIGTSLTIASSLAQRCIAFSGEQFSGQLRRSQLAAFVDISRDAANQLVANLTRAADLVQSFKQVAVNRIDEQRQFFDLNRATNQMLAVLRPALKGLDIAVTIDVPEGIMMNSYAGLYGLMLTNLFLNAATHGLGEIRRGTITITARRLNADLVEITFFDDGKGMSEAVRHHAFDPFFTTDRDRGGTGLGLHVVYNIVTQQFGGHIVLTSEPGNGTTFIISIPVVSPS